MRKWDICGLNLAQHEMIVNESFFAQWCMQHKDLRVARCVFPLHMLFATEQMISDLPEPGEQALLPQIC